MKGEEEMKRNKMMRIASALMVATLLSTSVISGTFAKYVTEDSASDTARVAKWGVTVQASGDLYATEYYSGSSTVVKEDDEDFVSVHGIQHPEQNNVVAPGTKNDKNGFVFSVKFGLVIFK